MRKLSLVLMLSAVFSLPVFAEDISPVSPPAAAPATSAAVPASTSAPVSASMPVDVSSGKPCGVIANACLSAGFVRTEIEGKRIWEDCMKPVILGQAVNGVTVDSTVVKACQVQKLEELQTELKELQNAMLKSS